MTPQPLPTHPTVDWGAIWARMLAGQEPVYHATKGEFRLFAGWVQYHHKRRVYYSSIGPETECVKKFSLNKQRGSREQWSTLK